MCVSAPTRLKIRLIGAWRNLKRVKTQSCIFKAIKRCLVTDTRMCNWLNHSAHCFIMSKIQALCTFCQAFCCCKGVGAKFALCLLTSVLGLEHCSDGFGDLFLLLGVSDIIWQLGSPGKGDSRNARIFVLIIHECCERVSDQQDWVGSAADGDHGGIGNDDIRQSHCLPMDIRIT